MVHHRKSHRKSHRKGSRRAQRGGGSCSAMPTNFDVFSRQQRGGMAPIAAGDSYLLDAATRVQAEVGPLDKVFGELPSVIPKQMGGRRHHRRSRHHRKGSRKAHRKGSRKAHRHHHKSRHTVRRSAHHKSQRGGMSDFNAPSMLLDRSAYGAAGMNPQFHDEGSVNPLYGEFRGAQA